MGKYYAQKIRGAYYLQSYLETKVEGHRLQAEDELNKAVTFWKMYAQAATRNYHPQFLAKTRTVDWEKLTDQVKNDILLSKQLMK